MPITFQNEHDHSSSSPSKVCPKCQPHLATTAGSSSVQQAIAREPTFTRRKKLPGHDKHVTFTTEYAEDNTAMQFRAGQRRVNNSAYPSTYQTNYTWIDPPPSSTSPIISAEQQLHTNQENAKVPAKHNPIRLSTDAGSKRPPVEPLAIPLSTDANGEDEGARIHSVPIRTRDAEMNTKAHEREPLKPTTHSEGALQQHKRKSKSSGVGGVVKKKKGFSSPLKRLYEADYQRQNLAKGMFETQYHAHFKDWQGKPRGEGKERRRRDKERKENTSPFTDGSHLMRNDPNDPRYLKHLPHPALPHYPPNLHWRTNYETEFLEPTKFRYENGTWITSGSRSRQTAAAGNADPVEEPSGSWFDQLVELREKAEHYKWKSGRTNFNFHQFLSLDPLVQAIPCEASSPPDAISVSETSSSKDTVQNVRYTSPSTESEARRPAPSLYRPDPVMMHSREPQGSAAEEEPLVIEDIEDEEEEEDTAYSAYQQARRKKSSAHSAYQQARSKKDSESTVHSVYQQARSKKDLTNSADSAYQQARSKKDSESTVHSAYQQARSKKDSMSSAHSAYQQARSKKGSDSIAHSHAQRKKNSETHSAYQQPDDAYSKTNTKRLATARSPGDVKCTCVHETQEEIEGRIPTPTLKELSAPPRHHLDLTTPSDQGILIPLTKSSPSPPIPLPYPPVSSNFRRDTRSTAPINPSSDEYLDSIPRRAAGQATGTEKHILLGDPGIPRHISASSSSHHAYCVPTSVNGDGGGQRSTSHVRKLNFDHPVPLKSKRSQTMHSLPPSQKTTTGQTGSTRRDPHLLACETCGVCLQPSTTLSRFPAQHSGGNEGERRPKPRSTGVTMVGSRPDMHNQQGWKSSVRNSQSVLSNGPKQVERVREKLMPAQTNASTNYRGVRNLSTAPPNLTHHYSKTQGYREASPPATVGSKTYTSNGIQPQSYNGHVYRSVSPQAAPGHLVATGYPGVSSLRPAYKSCDMDELSLSSMSLSNCSVASEVLEKARQRRDHFWTTQYQPHE